MSGRHDYGDEDERSEDEYMSGGAGGSTSTAKRTPRACDRCRKSKSKCEPAAGGGDRCKGCVAAGAGARPSFRRGPPKGYIKALERRLHQMESVLAAIMSSKDPRTTGLVADLRRDTLAKHILEGVDAGPFGPSGRKQRSVDPTEDNFFASIVSPTLRQQSERSRRQSRSTRESVIQAREGDRLSESLVRWAQSRQAADPVPSGSSRVLPVRHVARARDDGAEPARQRRRTVASAPGHDLSWDDVHGTADELDDTADAFGHLSLTSTVRYHGKLSGIHLLAEHQREDKRNFGGIWKFPMSKLWPPAPSGETEFSMREKARLRVEESIPVPPVDVQLHLIRLFFTYVNTSLPVLDEETFMEQYNADISFGTDPGPAVEPERMQKMSKLLLFSVFAFAAQYWDTIQAEQYAASARRLLGMAARMAFDLGLNRDSEKWLNHGHAMFSRTEQNIRKKIGRPVIVHEADFSTMLPQVTEVEDEVAWAPMHAGSQGQRITATPGLRQSYHRAAAALTVIHGEIVEKIYPVTRVDPTPRRALMERIHSRLLQWSIDLPEVLRYSSQSRQPCPPPHVLVLHIQFWSMMLLLHRPFIPKGMRSRTPPSASSADDTVPWKSYDFCQGAASHISAFATLFNRYYDIRWAPPLISSTIQSAGLFPRLVDVWPTAARVADLLRGAGVQIAVALTEPAGPSRKRPVEIVLEEYTDEAADAAEASQMVASDVPSDRYAEGSHLRPMPAAVPLPQPQPHQDPQYGPNFMAALLGPDYTPAASVAPGYDWWPLPLMMPSQSFTFTQEQFSQDFLQGIRDPVLHFPGPPTYPLR
ncbi:uncharacterized protein B0H18DRAFT_1067830 [Fomitopsis serialis]|uniref:uncharacterized protein n=1 Tax=Fomitopsis serialis TaxID=139415 RepID=UPI0020076733|nr:uncharacterized protein B0H18DRAFT_1067830 [Neoantrodia serialis]KAH9910628.1 hypothetical protein B0H18DRAFT_1067830 [Neoantrodia serialis]